MRAAVPDTGASVLALSVSGEGMVGAMNLRDFKIVKEQQERKKSSRKTRWK
jgi:hypothetical protein